MMTTADGMHPAFSGRHPKLFIISDIYRVVRKFPKCIPTSHEVLWCALYPFYLKQQLFKVLKILPRSQQTDHYYRKHQTSITSTATGDNLSVYIIDTWFKPPACIVYWCLLSCSSTKHFYTRFVQIQSNLNFSNSDISNSAIPKASFWIRNTFWMLSPTIIWRWGLFKKSKLPEVQINLHFRYFELVKNSPINFEITRFDCNYVKQISQRTKMIYVYFVLMTAR